ncbi:acyl-CoA N-acyltransferase [Rhizoclosmatium globosum]|uniref:Acyl-CoA N-acyltransferase n=1 Tax=Rhizoclosmatium globosum TaxID=329046 RepID=A0A1Y2BVL4_9FUNG|nr:acyl-CoA N-acyltransferase [Rhizoclosmatium globosum]|eukprot:ORY38786.1 acyl-CoA N-acyltransferase [Rhizoclosmatium globosum]
MESFSAPRRVETSRMILRSMTESDASVVQAAIATGLETQRRWMPWTASSNSYTTVAERIRAHEADWDAKRNFCYLGLDIATGEVAGLFGLYGVNIPSRFAQLGFWVAPRFAKEGRAKEAALCLLEIAVDMLRLDRITIMNDTRNIATAAVARSLGFIHEGTLRKDWLEEDGSLSSTMVWSRVRGIDFDVDGEMEEQTTTQSQTQSQIANE